MRSLISDPAVGYVPKFIVFLPKNVYVKARALFMGPSFLPIPKLVEDFPTCGAANCTDDDCGAFDLTASRSFVKDSTLLRHHEWVMDVVRCNLWICNEEEPADLSGKTLLQACKQCREVFYCCRDHQGSVCSFSRDDTIVYGTCCRLWTGTRIRMFANRVLSDIQWIKVVFESRY